MMMEAREALSKVFDNRTLAQMRAMADPNENFVKAYL